MDKNANPDSDTDRGNCHHDHSGTADQTRTHGNQTDEDEGDTTVSDESSIESPPETETPSSLRRTRKLTRDRQPTDTYNPSETEHKTGPPIDLWISSRPEEN
jgi:hypothetical protein